ncbi:MAG: LysR family transcriptional regulator [Pseudomonadota bacterium]
MPVSLRAMRYVQTAMQKGSIAAAAETLNVAPSAVATALNQAEDALGVTLVTRARAKGISPTLSGRSLLRRIDDLLERYDAMMADASELKAELTGNLTIGYNAPIAPAFLSKIAAKLLDENARITLSLVEEDNETAKRGLVDGRFDAIVFVEDLPNPQIDTMPLIHAPTYCLCRHNHPIASLAEVGIDRVLREPLVLLDRPAATTYYMELLAKGATQPKIVATANSTEMVRSLVAEAMGVSLLNMRPGNIPAYAGADVTCVPLVGRSHGVTLSLGYAPGPKRRLLQVFVEQTASFLSSPEGEKFIVC